MLYEYPNKFIVPIIYISTSDYNYGKHRIKTTDLIQDKNEKSNTEHKVRERIRDSENSKNTLGNFGDVDVISESCKDYYLENINMYSDIDDEYAKDETKKK